MVFVYKSHTACSHLSWTLQALSLSKRSNELILHAVLTAIILMANNNSNGFTVVNLYLQPSRTPNTPGLQEHTVCSSLHCCSTHYFTYCALRNEWCLRDSFVRGNCSLSFQVMYSRRSASNVPEYRQLLLVIMETLFEAWPQGTLQWGAPGMLSRTDQRANPTKHTQSTAWRPTFKAEDPKSSGITGWQNIIAVFLAWLSPFHDQ